MKGEIEMRLLLALMMVGCLATGASAANTVWFATDTAGGMGQMLELEGYVGEVNTYTVSMMLDQGDTFSGWAEDLALSSAGAQGATSVSGIAYGTWGPAYQSGVAAYDVGGFLASGAWQNAQPPFVQPGDYTLMTFELTWTPAALGDEDWIENWIGGAGWGNDVASPDYYAPFVSFGDNPPFWTIYTGYSAGPVIHLTAVPEPATLVLLGIGALALIRRR
jgi:hypothetical protein